MGVVSVPKPTMGRVVIFTKDNGAELPAVVVRERPDLLPGTADLHVLGSLNPNVLEVEYCSKPKPGHWRYPPRSEAVFEVSE